MTTEPTADLGDRTRYLLIAIAAAVGLAVATLAPDEWQPGSGSSVLEYLGTTVLEAPVSIGSEDPVSLRTTRGDLEISLTYPKGIPVDGEIVAQIAVREGLSRIEADAGEFVLHLESPDLGGETIPIVGWNDEEGHLEASRRPPKNSAVVLGLLGFVIVLWVSEALPLFVTSLLIPVGLVVSGVGGAVDATAPFFNPIVVLFFAGFLMAEAMRRCGLDHYLAVSITAGSRRSAVTLFGAMLGIAAVMSMFMSNTGAAAVLVPIAIAISDPIDEPGFRKALVLGIAYAATIGGVGSAIGTPANQLAIEFLGEFGGRDVAFVEWFLFGLPMVLLFLPLMGWYLWRTSDVELDRNRFTEVARLALIERERLGQPDRGQYVVLAVFVAVAGGWLTQTWHGLHPGLVALAGAVLLYILGRLDKADLSRISWSSLITFGGGLTLGIFIVRTGTSDYVATRLSGLSGAPELVSLMIIALITLILTTVASNTASAAVLIPLAIPLAGVLGMDPTLLVLIVAIASSVDFALVIGTPPTMIAYSTELFSARQIFRKGVVLDAVGIALLVLVVSRVWLVLGLV